MNYKIFSGRLTQVTGVNYDFDVNQNCLDTRFFDMILRQFGTITEFESGCFRNNKEITQVVMPEGVTRIGEYAFYGCTNLEEVVLPSTLVTIEAYAFSHCPKLSKVTFKSSKIFLEYSAFSYCNSLVNIELPEVSAIPGFCFESCKSLRVVKVPEKVKEISGYAFWGCENLVEISNITNVMYIGEGAFGHTNFKRLVLNEIENIGGCAFYNCGLEVVTIKGKLCVLETEIFDGCTKLEKVEIPNILLQVRHNAFHNCINLRTVILNHNISNVEADAFCVDSNSYENSELKINKKITVYVHEEGATSAYCEQVGLNYVVM